jgi:hypothetical protein
MVTAFSGIQQGLVANKSLQGNFLPNVDRYAVPFGDTIPAFKNKPLMVYEFDAGDVMNSTMYPAMARSFRTAGFWWATQFAYDPLYTAYGNTEYGTHYVNLAYTPSKAISLLIASKVFQRLPRHKSYGSFPADTLFDVFRLSHKNDLSEMNSDEEFYYTNSTSTVPKKVSSLKNIAGVGNSSVVKYGGTGAYFIRKQSDGSWLLEVMPDATPIRDPFAKSSPKKEVVRIQWESHEMQINLPHLGNDFSVTAVDEGNNLKGTANGTLIFIKPGVLSAKKHNSNRFKTGNKFSILCSTCINSRSVYQPYCINRSKCK